MKKALIISNSAGLVTDFLENDVRILIDKGYSIDCVCNTNYPGKETWEFFKKYNINVINVDFPIRNLDIKKVISSIREVSKILKNERYSIVHCHSTIAAVIGRHCAKKYRKNGLKIFYTSHGFPFYEGNDGVKAKVFKIIERYYSKFTDCIFTICEEDYKNALKFECSNVYLMHGIGVNVDRFKNTIINVKKKKKELGLDENKKIILSVGELNTNKNHEIIIRAISLLKDDSIIYAICGREVTEHGKMDYLKNLALQLKVNVVFLGFRTHDINEVYKCADIGALPSYKEGLGLSGIEMLASGLPLVASNRQGIRDYVIDGKTGYLANPDNANEFATAIKRTFSLLNENDTKKECMLIADKFNEQQAYNVILNGYNSML